MNKKKILAYQIRQSFKPGEVTSEEANQVGYETAMRWTKGKHAFIVATHIDKAHIHKPDPDADYVDDDEDYGYSEEYKDDDVDFIADDEDNEPV